MCGISGIIKFKEPAASESSIRSMLANMKHRGPDDEGIFIKDAAALGFVRLSIIDLTSNGHQPMSSDDGRFTMVYNGEIFNYLELRQELESSGVSFRTKTDTEVLLKAYIHWGKECLHKLNGMWAFAIYDSVSGNLFASRDRYGIKPFYYHHNDQFLAFASEIPPILSVLQKKPTANRAAIFDYLVFNRTDQDEKTFFVEVRQLKHGESLSIVGNQVKIEKWYELKKNLKAPFKSPDEFRDMLIDSVKLRLRSDVPVGVCFSGGLDSSSILSILVDKAGRNDVNTFSAVYQPGERGDESRFIDVYRSKVKNMHFITPSAESLFNDMHDLVNFHAEPIPDTSPYAQYKVMELAKKSVTVTLDGQGADEQLGGYHYFFGLYFKELFKKLRWIKLLREMLHYRQKHRSNFALKSFVFFLLPSVLRKKLRASRKGYLNGDFYSKYSRYSHTSDTIYGSTSLNNALLDHFEYKLEHLLKWADRNSMRFSVEARVPFLDHRIVERTVPLAADWIIRNGTTKFILREAMQGLLPEKIRLRQDKIGFATPEGEWFRKDYFKDFISDILDSVSFRERKIVDVAKAKQLYQDHLDRKTEIAGDIWKWINLELWFRKYID